MSRYIDADAFDERIRISVGLVEEELTDDYKDGVSCTLEMLKTQPTADVVRCKDCIHYKDLLLGQPATAFGCNVHNWFSGEDDYCSFGERREDGEIH